MAKKELTGFQKWFEEIILESFRSEKKMYEYMDSKPEEKWHKVEKFSNRALLVYGECAIEDDDFFENSKGQYIDTEYKRLYNVTVEEFAEQFNLIDDDEHPILIDYFKPYENSPEKIAQLLPEAYKKLHIPNIASKSDLKLLNDWVKDQIMEKRTPDFYAEKIYAYLIIIIGELLRNTKLKGTRWKVVKRNIKIPDQYTPVDCIYHPYLVNEEGELYDIVFSFRQNLFLSNGASFLISKVFNNIKTRSYNPRWM